MTRTLPWQKPDPVKNYYPVPKVICQLGLSPGEIAVYSFLLFCEDRKTYQCYPSYRTIGEAVGMSRNTVCKYVRSLEEKGLIRTERTAVLPPVGQFAASQGGGGVRIPPSPFMSVSESFSVRRKQSRRKALALFRTYAAHGSPQCGLPRGVAGF